MTRTPFVAACLGAFFFAAALPRAQSPEAELRTAIELEKVKGDTVKAIELYTKLTTSPDPMVAAKAREALARLRGTRSVASDQEAFKEIPPDTRLGFTSIPSPDGTRALEYRQGILLRDLATGREQMLAKNETDDGFNGINFTATYPVWSPDGRRVAFYRAARGRGTAQPSEIRIASLATGEMTTAATFPRQMVAGRTGVMVPAPPPDVALWAWTSTDRIVYLSVGRGRASLDLASVTTKGGDPTPVPAAGLPSIPNVLGSYTDGRDRVGNVTPDGRSIAIVSAEHLSLFDLTTGKERVLSTGIAPAYPQISPDGTLVAFLMRRDNVWGVYVAPLERLPIQDPLRVVTLAHRSVAVPYGFLRWKAGGVLTFDYQETEDNLYRIDISPATGKASGPLVRLTQNIDGKGPVISPDGRSILFSGHNSRVAPDYNIYAMAADGSQERRLIERPDSGRYPGQPSVNYAWLSNDAVVFSRPDRSDLLVKDVRTGREEGLPGSSDVNPDSAGTPGRRWDGRLQYLAPPNIVVYERRVLPPRLSLVMRSLANGSDTDVKGVEPIQNWAIAPDRRRVAYWMAYPSQGRTEGWELHLSSVDGSGDRVIAKVGRDAGALDVCWAPDNRRLLYSDGAPHIIDVDSGESRPLLDKSIAEFFAPGQLSQTDGWTWSPTGTFVVFSAHTTETRRHAWSGVTADAVRAISKK